jgi:DNA polymerase V
MASFRFDHIPPARAFLLGPAAAAGPAAAPLLLQQAPAGFPSPADDYVDKAIDLGERLVERPESTFLMRVRGESMAGAGIMDGAVLVVDRAEEPRPGRVVIAVLDGELTVKRLARRGGRLVLAAEHPDYPDIEIDPERDFEVWGVVRHAINEV